MDIQALIFKTAKERFNVHAVRPYQTYVMFRILEHERQKGGGTLNLLTVFPTGFGKSLCFMVPASLIDGLTVVVYPLLALMREQRDRFEKAGVPAVILQGGQTKEQRKKIFAALESGRTRVLITNPEMLCSAGIAGRLAAIGVRLLVVDEAHTVVQWGKSFRPAYLRLKDFIFLASPHAVLAFTATAGPQILEELKKQLFSGSEPLTVYADPDRPNIIYRYSYCLSKTATLIQLLKVCPKPALVFTGTRSEAERIYWELSPLQKDLELYYYHAGLSKEERKKVEKIYAKSRDAVLLSTCAFGMGMDKSDIRTVIHTALPASVEEFLQESGRAGRDGGKSTSWTLLTPLDVKKAQGAKKELVDCLTGKNGCIRQALLAKLNRQLAFCSGCDVCEKAGPHLPFELLIVLQLVRMHPLRYTPARLSRLLCGTRTGNKYGSSAPCFGLLPTWDQRRLTRAIRSLIEAGEIRSLRILGHERLYRLNALKKFKKQYF